MKRDKRGDDQQFDDELTKRPEVDCKLLFFALFLSILVEQSATVLNYTRGSTLIFITLTFPIVTQREVKRASLDESLQTLSRRLKERL